jgi:hypothetical protein
MRINSVIVALALLLISGCATYQNDNLDRLRTLPQQYAEFDVKMAWEVKPVDGSTVIDGVVKNIRYYEMDDLEIWVASLDAKGKEEHRAVDYVYRLRENETARFTLKIPQVASGHKLRFWYSYSGSEGGGDSGNALTWRQSFDSAVP